MNWNLDFVAAPLHPGVIRDAPLGLGAVDGAGCLGTLVRVGEERGESGGPVYGFADGGFEVDFGCPKGSGFFGS